jgi:hypothetical protein
MNTSLGHDLLLQVVTLWRFIVERLPDFDADKAKRAS